MKYKYPHYYKEFQCIASACEATCCAGWEIVIDEESVGKYLEIRTDFGNRLCNSIDFKEGVFHQDNKKRCAFLNDNNLCDIYAELGEEYLCYTCERYPRHIEEFEEVNEVSLSISCPEVAKRMLDMTEKVTFYEEEIDEEVEEFEEFDFLFYELLYELRELIFRILQNREIPIMKRMEWTSNLACEVQKKIDAYQLFELEDVIEKHEKFYHTKGLMEKELQEPEQFEIEKKAQDKKAQYEKNQEYLEYLYQVEVLQEDWRPKLDAWKTHLYDITFEEYWNQRDKFVSCYQNKLEYMKEQIMIYFIYSYFCGAVYDGEVLSKYLLAHVSTNIIEELWFAQYLEKKEPCLDELFYKVVYQYAREIEHSDQNIETLEELIDRNSNK
ncbi:MAG: flagellin lysine-N-methylase [Eubacteriales bacterium]